MLSHNYSDTSLMQDKTETQGLYPWYVHIIGGWSLGGLFSWFLVIRKFFKSGRRKTAFLLAFANILLFLFFSYIGYTCRLPWDTLSLAAIVTNILWSVAAWAVQISVFGHAPRRYYFSEWRNWISPIVTAIVLGIGVSVLYSISPMVSNRIQMYQARDLLTKNLILWDFFRYIPVSIIISLPLGLWWAGEREKFTISRVLSYIFGLPLFYLMLMGSIFLFFFLLSHGDMTSAISTWNVIPLNPQGLQKFFLGPMKMDYSTYFVAPLIFGLTPRIRNFFRKSLIYLPVLCIILLGYYGFSYQFWQFMQNRIVYDMSSENTQKRDKAYGRASFLLARFPEHRGWPVLGLELARYHYLAGDTQKAYRLYSDTYAKSGQSPRWTREAGLAETAFQSPHFGDLSGRTVLELPQIPYESYMTSNWMSLIRLIRYYEQDTTPESQTLIRLKTISESDTEIELSPMPTLAELDDNASALGYDVVLIPAELESIKRIIKGGFPVILPIRNSFHLLFGIDEGRSLIEAACYRDVLRAARKIQNEELSLTSLREEKMQNDENSWTRLNYIAGTELPYSFWGSERQNDMGQYAAVVLPKNKSEEFYSLAGNDPQEILKRSDAILSGFIALNSLKSGDVVGTVDWARKSCAIEPTPFALHVAHLATLLWNSREQMIWKNLQLEQKFPQLAGTENSLQQPDRAEFLAKAKERFAYDLGNRNLSWMIRDQYKDFLDRSKKEDREILIAITAETVEREPFSRGDWLSLAELYEWERDSSGAAYGYKGALESDYWNDRIAVRLASLYVSDGKLSEADSILELISEKSVRFNPDYYYCRAAVSQWRGDFDKARNNYEAAIRIRKFDPAYHIAYADFLQKQDESPGKVEMLRAWASKLNGAAENASSD